MHKLISIIAAAAAIAATTYTAKAEESYSWSNDSANWNNDPGNWSNSQDNWNNDPANQQSNNQIVADGESRGVRVGAGTFTSDGNYLGSQED